MPTLSQPLSLRFAITPSVARCVRRFRCLRPLTVSRATRHRIAFSYWDTLRFLVHEYRQALQLIRLDAGPWVERVYRENPDGHFRIEREAPVDGERFSARTAKSLNVDLRVLRPVVGARVTRSQWTIRCENETTMVLFIDRGNAWTAGERRSGKPVLELELSLVHGSADRLYALASDMVDEAAAMRFLSGDATERAFRRLDSAIPRSRERDLEGALSAAGVAYQAGARSLAQIADHLRGARDGNAEALHQLRVGLRRFRTVDRIGRKVHLARLPETARADLAWLWALLGTARDWDVFATGTWPAVVERTKPRRVLRRFATAASTLRAESYAQLHRALNGKRFQKMLLSLDACERRRHAEAVAAEVDKGATTAGELATRVLALHARRVRHRGKGIGDLSSGKLHALRIEAKRLRYLGEFFAPLYPSEGADRYLERVAAIQAVLGRMNDLAVGEVLASQVDAHLGGSSRETARSHYATYRASAERKLRVRLAREFGRFRGVKPFWT